MGHGTAFGHALPDLIVPCGRVVQIAAGPNDQPLLGPGHGDVKQALAFLGLFSGQLFAGLHDLSGRHVGTGFPQRQPVGARQDVVADGGGPLGGVGQEHNRRLKPL